MSSFIRPVRAECCWNWWSKTVVGRWSLVVGNSLLVVGEHGSQFESQAISLASE